MRALHFVVACFLELVGLACAVVASPFVALDERRGFTQRARYLRALEAHLGSEPTAIASAGGERTVVEGTIELDSAPVRSPLVDGDLVWWSAYACDGGVLTWVAGELAPFHVADRSGRVRVDIDHARDVGIWAGEHRAIDVPPREWAGAARGEPDEWLLTWLRSDDVVRASGLVERDASTLHLRCDAGGVRVIVSRLARPPVGGSTRLTAAR